MKNIEHLFIVGASFSWNIIHGVTRKKYLRSSSASIHTDSGGR
jgi:hypothetical protein